MITSQLNGSQAAIGEQMGIYTYGVKQSLSN